MDLFPHFPLHLNKTALFALTLMFGLLGGELAKRIRYLPVISGYIAIGFLIGPGGFNIATPSVLATARIFVEISLSLIMFDLGRHLDFRWLYHDRGLLPMAAAESSFTFIMIFSVVYFIVGLPWLQAALAGTIAMATSPAVVMMVAHDLSSEGPVTRRTLLLTSLNNLFALILFTALVSLVNADTPSSMKSLSHIIYHIGGSLALGLLLFLLAQLFALLIGKNKQNQFILFVSLVTLAASLANIFNLPAILVLFTLGAAARNLDRRHILMDIDFGWLARLFIVLLFVVTGAHLQLKGIGVVAGAVLLFILVRGLAKFAGVWLFSGVSNLSRRQVLTVSLALSPMAGLAIGMSNMLVDFNPDFGHPLLLIITGVVAVLHIVGPIATQLAFIKSGETLSTAES